MNQDQEHLRLLSIFHYGFAALFACIPIIHLVIGLVIFFSPQNFGPGNNPPPKFLGLLFVVVASCFIVFGWRLPSPSPTQADALTNGKKYTYCLVMAGIACLFMPFGTILGIFSIIVLVRPSVKTLFNTATPPAFAS